MHAPDATPLHPLVVSPTPCVSPPSFSSLSQLPPVLSSFFQRVNHCSLRGSCSRNIERSRFETFGFPASPSDTHHLGRYCSFYVAAPLRSSSPFRIRTSRITRVNFCSRRYHFLPRFVRLSFPIPDQLKLAGVFFAYRRRPDYKNIGKREGRANNSFDLIKADRIRITCQLTGDGSVNRFRRVSRGEGYVKILSFIPWHIRGIYETREAQLVHLNENWKLEERRGRDRGCRERGRVVISTSFQIDI